MILLRRETPAAAAAETEEEDDDPAAQGNAFEIGCGQVYGFMKGQMHLRGDGFSIRPDALTDAEGQLAENGRIRGLTASDADHQPGSSQQSVR